jgi:hypothetical protein
VHFAYSAWIDGGSEQKWRVENPDIENVLSPSKEALKLFYGYAT